MGETRFMAIMEKHGLRVFANKELKRIFGLNRDE
jgi:hypothetical protein